MLLSAEKGVGQDAMYRARAMILALVAGLIVGCGREPEGREARIAVSTSYLAAVVRDVLDADVPVVGLSGPGTCPGHFDITPSHLARIRRCRVLLRFDFQRHVDAKLQAAVDEGLRIVDVPEPGNLCEPSTYRAVCQATAAALARAGLLEEAAAGERLAEIDARLAGLAQDARRRAREAGLEGWPVVAAHHQASFCRWLGLDVVAEFTGSDNPAALNAVVADGREGRVGLVVGNAPQGRVVPDRLAEILGTPVVLFENFPPAGAGREAFDGLVRGNVERLCAAGAEARRAAERLPAKETP